MEEAKNKIKVEETNQDTIGKMPKKTLYALIALVVATVLLLILAVYNFNVVNKKAVTNQGASSSFAHTSMSLTYPISSDKANYTEYVNIDTGTNKVKAVSIRISYDPKALRNVAVTPGAFFTSPIVLLKKVDTQKGIISLDLSTSPNDQPISGQGSVATITFTKNPSAAGTTYISFTPDTIVTAEGVTESVLKSTYGNSFILSIK